jgi:hypothetical protein
MDKVQKYNSFNKKEICRLFISLSVCLKCAVDLNRSYLCGNKGRLIKSKSSFIYRASGLRANSVLNNKILEQT